MLAGTESAHCLHDRTAAVFFARNFADARHAARGTAIAAPLVGTHGRTGLRHVLLGSVSERVIQHAPCVVLVVCPDQPAKATSKVASDEVAVENYPSPPILERA